MSERALLVPEVVQTSAMDCGPAALKSLLEGFGIPISYGRLREACQTDVDGTSIDALEDLAVRLGLDAEQVLVPVDHVLDPDSGSLPALAVVQLPNGFTHFVLIWRRHGPLVQVMDPAGGRRWTTARQLTAELYAHAMPLPAEAFRQYAAGPEMTRVLARRIDALGASAARERWLAEAFADPSPATLTALDASVRMVQTLVESRAIAAGREALALVERLLARVREDPDVIPPEHWTARPLDDAHLEVTGAVLVRVRGRRTSSTEPEVELPPELVTALAEAPTRPGRRLLALLREDGLFAPALVALAALASSIGVMVEALIFRGVLELGELVRLPEQRVVTGLALAAFPLLLLGLQLPLGAASLRMGRHLEARLRLALLRKIPRLSDRYFHSRLTSDMAQRAHAIPALRALPQLGASVATSALGLAATSAGLVWLDPSRSLAVVTVAALSVILPLALQPLLAERDLRVQTQEGALARFHLDALLGITPLRAHGAYPALRREHEARLLEWERASRGLLGVKVGVEALTIASGVALAAWLLVGYLADDGRLGGALLLVFWALRVPALGEALARSAQRYPHVRNAALRLLEPLDAPEEAPVTPVPLSGEGAVGLALEAVTVRAGGHVILDEVSLAIAPGEHVAVVGPSGAGKSTLVGLLLGWHRAAAGRVLVDGAPLDGARQAGLREVTAWLDPAVQLWNRSLLENLRYGSEDGTQAAIARALEEAELLGVLESLPEGLATVLGEGGALVSGGEGQRVRLGRAMMREGARLAIFDEPFRGLDRATRRHLFATARKHFRNATMLFVTHDLEQALALDRVVVVDGGRVVEDGAPATLMADASSGLARLVAAERAVGAELWARGFRRVRLEDGVLTEGR